MRSSSTCGMRRSITCATIGLPRNSCNPLSTPPMRLPCPPASTTPVTSIVGEGMKGRPGRALLEKGIAPWSAIDRRHEECERQVNLVRPTPVLGLEAKTRTAPGAEFPPRTFGREVVSQQLCPLGKAHLRALKADPGDDPRGMRGAATETVAVGAEARRECGDDLHAAAVAARHRLEGFRHGREA